MLSNYRSPGSRPGLMSQLRQQYRIGQASPSVSSANEQLAQFQPGSFQPVVGSAPESQPSDGGLSSFQHSMEVVKQNSVNPDGTPRENLTTKATDWLGEKLGINQPTTTQAQAQPQAPSANPLPPQKPPVAAAPVQPQTPTPAPVVPQNGGGDFFSFLRGLFGG